MTTWSHDKQLEMLQLIKLSYEMTNIHLKGEDLEQTMKGRGIGNLADGSLFFGDHLKNLKAMEEHDGHFHYTNRPRKLSTLPTFGAEGGGALTGGDHNDVLKPCA